MTSSELEKPRSVAEAIDAIEATYELMLAYAAQGREREEDDPMGIRQALRRAGLALDVLDAATPRDLSSPGGAAEQATADMLAAQWHEAPGFRANPS